MFFAGDFSVSNQAFEDVACNLCGSKEKSVVFSEVPQEKQAKQAEKGGGKKAWAGKAHEKFHVTSSALATERVVKCSKCGLVFISPRPARGVVIKGYATASGADYVSQAENRIRTFRSAVRVLDAHAFPNGRPAGGKPRVLDVGSAAGFFLKAAKDDGWQPFGVEPNAWMVKWGNKKFGLRMKRGTLQDARFKTGFFDAVTMWDVLEHVSDPKATLREANRVLKKGGLLAVNFPNIGSRLARLAGRKWWFLTSVHLYYFTPETLSRMLEETGFEVVLVKRHYQRLNVGYMLEWHKRQTRAAGKSTALHDALISVLKALRLHDKRITYYASQTLVLARKV
jgi:2-polyprenyl-3-methyl-5-hydroxy-6-metoxy-1,4-benzoquinol methylase